MQQISKKPFHLAQLTLGEHYLNHNAPDQGIQWLTKSANNQNGDAALLLHMIYESGKHGFEKDTLAASNWLYKAAELGSANAMFKLNIELVNGFCGSLPDAKEAHHWLLKAAELGHVYAKYFCAIHYYYGYHEEKNYQEAAKWFREFLNSDHNDPLMRENVEILHEAMRLKSDAAKSLRLASAPVDFKGAIKMERTQYQALAKGLNEDINFFPSSNGRTALHWAALSANFNKVNILLEAKANPAIKDKEGKTPAQLVPECVNRDKIVRLLSP